MKTMPMKADPDKDMDNDAIPHDEASEGKKSVKSRNMSARNNRKVLDEAGVGDFLDRMKNTPKSKRKKK